MAPTDNFVPAFPRPASQEHGESAAIPAQEGMSLRDWFAGMICNGLVAATAHTEAKDFVEPGAAEVLGQFSYYMADRMLEARDTPWNPKD